jgi:radical SAM/Cys-rich protein
MAQAPVDCQNDFDQMVIDSGGTCLAPADIDVIQVNIGLTCNLACRHCHVASSPKRTEQMDRETMEAILIAAESGRVRMIDITGGAPEMNPHFREFITRLRLQDHAVQVRTNLTILLEDAYRDIPAFYRDHQVQLVASLPCYLEENVDQQRGEGVYWDSVEVLKTLNNLGYGVDESLPLHLVFNPQGPVLPPDQAALEADYRRELDQRFGILFTGLYAITNMPIGRFFGDLRVTKKDGEYLDLLKESFNPGTLEGLMCRHQVNVDWNGNLYDCDFNLALKLGLSGESTPGNIRVFNAEALLSRRITTANHCFGCTAGCGSSCGGTIV